MTRPALAVLWDHQAWITEEIENELNEAYFEDVAEYAKRECRCGFVFTGFDDYWDHLKKALLEAGHPDVTYAEYLDEA